MRAGPWLSAAGCAALASLAIALPGCGSSSPAAEKTSVNSSGRVVPTHAGESRPSTDPIVSRSCPTELTRFADSLQRLRHRLVAGLTYDQYVAAVKALRSEYAAIRVDAVPPACLLATGTPSERAFDVYIEAANRWGECLSEPGCDAADVEAPLQAEWHLASRQLGGARDGDPAKP
jgi:hypothetical protein